MIDTKTDPMTHDRGSIEHLCYAVKRIEECGGKASESGACIELCLREILPGSRLAIVLFDKVSLRTLKVINIDFPYDQLQIITEIGRFNQNISGLLSALEGQSQGQGQFNTIAHGHKDFDRRQFSAYCLMRERNPDNTQSLTIFLKMITPYLHSTVANEYHHELTMVSTVQALSCRELEILSWVSKGKTNYEIAVILAISAFTVKNHISNILGKLDVSNRAHALEVARDLGYF